MSSNFIEGVACASVSGQSFAHVSPAVHDSVAEVPRSGLMDVVAVVQAMNLAQALISKTTREERDTQILKFLNEFADGLSNDSSAVAKSLALDIGMPIQHAEHRTLPAAIETVRETIHFFENDRTAFPAAGNTAVFLGWTDPLLTFCRRVPQTLASGNGVCVKPSSRAPRTIAKVATLVTQALNAAGLPQGLFAVLNGHGPGEDEVGESLLRHPGIKTIFWVGSSDRALVARAIAEEHEKRFHFAGSGRNPLLLFQGHREQDLEGIVDRLATAISDPHGYGPFRPSRLFIQESIYKDVLEKLSHNLSLLKLGDPLKHDTDVGPLPHKEAENFDNQIKMALSETGHLVTGGKRTGLFAEPTLIRDLTNCSTLQSEELSGPWATCASFKYAHEALKYANTSPLGLAGFVLNSSADKAEATALKLEASRVFFDVPPKWPGAFTANVAAVKNSGNWSDGIAEIYHFGQWCSAFLK